MRYLTKYRIIGEFPDPRSEGGCMHYRTHTSHWHHCIIALSYRSTYMHISDITLDYVYMATLAQDAFGSVVPQNAKHTLSYAYVGFRMVADPV